MRIPYVYERSDGSFDCYVRNSKGRKFFVGRFVCRINAFIEHNRMRSLMNGGSCGLLLLQKGLRMKSGRLVDKEIMKVTMVVPVHEPVPDDGHPIPDPRVDNELLSDLFDNLL